MGITDGWRVRDLPFSARLVLGVFLVSVGLGYAAALVQLHFQHAGAGKPMPDREDVIRVFHGIPGASEMERLLVTPEDKPFASGGQMRSAFFDHSTSWKAAIRKKQRAMQEKNKEAKVTAEEAEKELRKERTLEVTALVDWVKKGAQKETWEEHPLPADFKKNSGMEELDGQFFECNDDGTCKAKISAINETRCARCHAEGKSGSAGQVHLETYEGFKDYCDVPTTAGVSREKLAQSTHVHLLGFAVLYAMTGLIFATTSWPGILRVLIAPLPLVAQLVDIGCWWLARESPFFAEMIIYSGAVVAGALFLQIVLSLFDLYGWFGKFVVLLVLVALGLGAWQVYERVVNPYLTGGRPALLPTEVIKQLESLRPSPSPAPAAPAQPST